MTRVTIEELQKDLLRYLDVARSGEVVEISEGGFPIAEL
jgi:antitoxin (DNA-binding transcriptional repressor) of toxin-antitoxin stability system